MKTHKNASEVLYVFVLSNFLFLFFFSVGEGKYMFTFKKKSSEKFCARKNTHKKKLFSSFHPHYNVHTHSLSCLFCLPHVKEYTFVRNLVY